MFAYQYILKGQPGKGILQFENLLTDDEQFEPWVEQAVIADLQAQGKNIDREIIFSIQLMSGARVS